MARLLKLSLFISCMVLGFPFCSAAEETEPGMKKTEWLSELRASAAVPICKSFVEDETIAQQMKLNHISYDNCVALIPEIAMTCEKQYDADVPEIINNDNAEKWGQLIGDCIGHHFATQYLHSDA